MPDRGLRAPGTSWGHRSLSYRHPSARKQPRSCIVGVCGIRRPPGGCRKTLTSCATPQGAPPSLEKAMPAKKKSTSKEMTGGPSPIRAGLVAPDFQLPDDLGVPRRLSDFRGQPVVLYFYPADDTSGCTKEACGFRDDYALYRQDGFTILGVSPDSAASHAKFKGKYDLPFPLLADEGHKVCSMYGVWGPKQFMGRTYEGVLAHHLPDRPSRKDRACVRASPTGGAQCRGARCTEVDQVLERAPRKYPTNALRIRVTNSGIFGTLSALLNGIRHD